MDRLQGSEFLAQLTGRVHLIQYDAVSSIDACLARRTLEAPRSTEHAAGRGSAG